MKPTHQQLLQAVRDAGRGRDSFTCADVREQLGLSTKDRQKLNQFYRSFRAFQAAASAEVEKVGTNCYRLIAQEPAAVESEVSEVIEVDRAELSEVSAITALEIAAAASAPVQAVALEPAPIAVSEARAEEPVAAPEVVSAVRLAAQPEPSAVPAWRGHMQRFGRRVRSLFGGGGRAASVSREAGAAAQL